MDIISNNAWALLFALLLDRLLGEPSGYKHPLVWFGQWVDWLKKTYQLPLSLSPFSQRIAGVLAWSSAVLPGLLLICFLPLWLPDWGGFILSTLVLYFCLGWQSLREHIQSIIYPLAQGHLDEARDAVGRIVSRDTSHLTDYQVAQAGAESLLENGSDAIFAPIFWFVLLGAPGVLLYRLANTLDAMWGYRTPSLRYFGWCAARVDDVLNYIPARIVVYTYALCGNWALARQCARRQGHDWKSPNAGPVMAAGAGALGITLGGEATYFGHTESRPVLGEGPLPQVVDLRRAIWLIDKGVYLWAVLICLMI